MSKDKAILFGSIGVIAETSDIQRRAYNAAFEEKGLSWSWSRDEYRELLVKGGGRARLRRMNESTGAGLEEADILAIHRRKIELACAEIREEKTPLRSGVQKTIENARARDIRLALVTTTYPANIKAVIEPINRIQENAFDVIISVEDVAFIKPNPEAYQIALGKLGVKPENAVAVEDTTTSLASAKRAGLYAICTPGELTDQQDFSAADELLDELDSERVLSALGTR